MANNKRTAAGDRNKRIQVERRRGSVVEKIEGTASQIARYDNHLNEYKAATKGTSGSGRTRTASSFKAAPRSGVGKLLASGLNLLQGAAVVASKIGGDAANKIVANLNREGEGEGKDGQRQGKEKVKGHGKGIGNKNGIDRSNHKKG